MKMFLQSQAVRNCLPMLVAIAVVTVAAQSADAQILVNGGFDGTGGTQVGGSDPGAVVPDNWAGFATGNASLNSSGSNVTYNGGNQAPGSYVQQTVTVNPGDWYLLQWDHQDGPGSHPDRAVSTLELWDGATAAGAADLGDRAVRYPTLNIPHVFNSTTGQSTVRFGDAGSDTTSNDVRIDNASIVLANGSINVAPSLGTASAFSVHGSFGTDPQQAVDGSSNFGDGLTNYHSAGSGDDEFWRLDFAEPLLLVTGIEIQARTSFNNRNGDVLDILDSGGGVIDSIGITNGALFAASGVWESASAVVIRNAGGGQSINLAEVRVFAEFINGVQVPEPASLAIWAILGMALAGFRYRPVRTRK